MADPRDSRTQRPARGGGFRPGAGQAGRQPIQHSPCPDSIDALKSALTAIPAPYNFVPLAPWVHRPAWGRQVSLDLPFRDGVCGEIPFVLVADTPLLVGAEQEKHPDRAGEVRFAQAPDETYLVPGSALRGMLRSVAEIAGFGRLRQVDDNRYGLRDISTSDSPYARKVREIRAGFLRRGEDGGRVLVPCRWAKLAHEDLERWWGERMPIFRRGASVGKKYALWDGLCRDHGIAEPLNLRCTIDADRVSALSGPTLAYPVLTGQINDRERDRHAKQHDFVFYDRDETRAIPIADEDWRAFLLIHGDREAARGGDAMRPSWPDHWRERFNRGEAIPVFWLDAGLDRAQRRRVRLGLARMPKLAWDWSIHELIGHTEAEHLKGPEQGGLYDLADLLFGTLADLPGRTLKGRVSVGNALAEPIDGRQPQPQRQAPTILNGPKPTYFPNYIRQQTGPGWTLAREQYATCIDTGQGEEPEIRGFKRYPARPQAAIQPLTPEQRQGSQAVANVLHPLPAGTRFAGRILFHNLRPAELGALIWALTWGVNPRLRHSLGMGKPFGFGQVRFEIDWSHSRATPNAALDQPPASIDPAVACTAFASHMQAAYPGDLPGTWQDSPQLRALLAMADPERAADFPAALRHMRLQRCIEPGGNRAVAYNEFVWAKQRHLVLAEYDPAATPTVRQTRRSDSARGTGAPSHHLRPAPRPTPDRPPPSPPRTNIEHPWLKAKVAEIQKANHSQEDEVIGGKQLAAAWEQIADPADKAAVLAAIKALWEAKGWWDEPPGKGKRQVKSMYGAN